MFESIIVRPLKPTKVTWDNVKYITAEEPEQEKPEHYQILKGADTYLHKKLDLKPGTSKEVFKKSEEIWNQLKNKQLSELNTNPESRDYFDLNKKSLIYLVDDYHQLVDVFDAYDETSVENFMEMYEKFKLEITTFDRTRKFYIDGKGGLTKLVCYDKDANIVEDPYTPVVMIEFNTTKSTYKVYTGILLYNIFTYIPTISSYMECDSYSDLVKSLDMKAALEYAQNNAAGLYESYNKFKETPFEISARELISLLKKVGFKLELKDDDQMDAIPNLSDEEGNEKIQEFFNTFRFTTGETAYDIMALSELKKIFRYNKLTLLDMLTILSKEYLNSDATKITADVLCNIVYNLYDKKNDKRQADSIKEEISE